MSTYVLKTPIKEYIFTPMFIAILSTRDKIWTQPKDPSKELDRTAVSHTLNEILPHYLKKNKLGLLEPKMTPEKLLLREISQEVKMAIGCFFSMWNMNY